jgi:hypothetical protein
MLFMPKADGPEGSYSILSRPYGWSDCNADQNAFLHANKDSHVPATQLRQYTEEGEGHAWGALRAFKVFVIGGFVRDGVRKCSRCLLPGHTKRTCELPEALELEDV